MSAGDERYADVNGAWPATVPPCSRAEAEKAARAIYRHFGGLQHGSPAMMYPATFDRVRRCWITRGPGSLYCGWPRLAHDISHRIFRKRHPSFRPHDGGHATLEREVALFVLNSGYLEGILKTLPRPKPTAGDKLAAIDARVKRWETKAKRAETALRKLRRQRAALVRRTVTRVTDSDHVGA